jgi:hypothetical protein
MGICKRAIESDNLIKSGIKKSGLCNTEILTSGLAIEFQIK